MSEEIALENESIYNYQGLVTLTLDRPNRDILNTVVHDSSIYRYTYKPNFIEIEETFCGRIDGFIRSTKDS